ncbi:MAG: DUF3006 domain-containing protein [Oscillospiraceae bacterium]|jgi:hypothetical protein
MYVVIDRFEGDFAVVELPDGSFAKLPRTLVPTDAGESSVLKIETDAAETARRQNEAQALFKKLTDK